MANCGRADFRTLDDLIGYTRSLPPATAQPELPAQASSTAAACAPAPGDPQSADPHAAEMASSRKSRRLTAEERAQLSSPAYHLAHDIGEEARRYKNERDVGYGDLQYDIDAASVSLWWKGPVPRRICALVQAGAGRHVDVDVHEAAYSVGYLLTRPIPHQSAELDAAGIRIESVSVARGAAGHHVDISFHGVGGDEDARAALVRRVGEHQTGVPVATVVEGPERGDFVPGVAGP